MTLPIDIATGDPNHADLHNATNAAVNDLLAGAPTAQTSFQIFESALSTGVETPLTLLNDTPGGSGVTLDTPTLTFPAGVYIVRLRAEYDSSNTGERGLGLGGVGETLTKFLANRLPQEPGSSRQVIERTYALSLAVETEVTITGQQTSGSTMGVAGLVHIQKLAVSGGGGGGGASTAAELTVDEGDFIRISGADAQAVFVEVDSQLQTVFTTLANIDAADVATDLTGLSWVSGTNVFAFIENLSTTLDEIFTGQGEISSSVSVAVSASDSAGAAAEAAQTTADAAVPKALYDANSILAATTDDTPAALAVPASTFVGRKASGGISAMSVAEATTLLGISAGGGIKSFTKKVRSSGTSNYTVNTASAWADLDNANLDVALTNVATGDIIEVDFSGYWDSDSFNAFLDWAIINAGSRTAYISGQSAAGDNTHLGVVGAGKLTTTSAGLKAASMKYKVLSGDHTSGAMTVRTRVRSTGSTLLVQSATAPLVIAVTNLGPSAT